MSSTRPSRRRKLPPAWAVVALVCAAAVLLARTLRVAVVRGGSMEPSLRKGDYLLTESLSPAFGKVARFDTVTFKWPTPAGKEFVKRVIALPGETVEIKSGRVYVEGRELTQPFSHARGVSCFGPAVVPEGHYFLLGDNRVSSVDSTLWGPIPARLVTGVVRARVEGE